MATIATLLIDLGMNVARLKNDFEQAGRTVDRGVRDMQRTMGNLKRVFEAVVGGTGLALIGREMLQAAKEGEQASARLTAVLRATGHQAGLTKAELDDMADRMQAGLGFDDESLRNAQATLLKFGNIHGNVFREAMKLSADLAAFMGTNVPEAAQMLGKSLQSPTEGLTMMERQFGKLAPEQEKHIENLVKQGRAVEAQTAVLEIWRSKIGGVAEEMNTGLTQATRDVKNAWNDMLESWGRTPVVGGAVSTVLRQIAKDLRGLAPQKDTVVTGIEQQISMLDAEIARIERTRPAKGRSPLIDEQIVELKAQRAGLKAGIDAIRDVENFEAGLAAGGAARGVVLGGGNDKGAEAAAQREAEFRAQKAIELEEMAAQDSREAWEFYTKGRLEQDERIRKARAEGFKAWFEEIDAEQDRAIEAGAALLEAEAARKAALKGTMDAARELGLTFQSAFEDAIVEGKALSEVLKAIEKDIARIIIRKSVTEPAANAITGALAQGFGSWFGGDGAEQLGGPGYEPRAGGGPVMAGQSYLVGEEGPEVLTMGASSGHVIPNGGLGGDVYITQNIHVDSRSDQATIMQAMHIAKEQAKAEIRRKIRSGSSDYSAD